MAYIASVWKTSVTKRRERRYLSDYNGVVTAGVRTIGTRRARVAESIRIGGVVHSLPIIFGLALRDVRQSPHILAAIIQPYRSWHMVL